ncbi:MAG: hypothetical protein IKF07_04210 [Eubacterium sp.]|nr:hypothetical protein [Eubacterium sp.]
MYKFSEKALTGFMAMLAAVLVILAVPFFQAPVSADTNAGDRIAVDVTGKSEGYSAILYDNLNGLPTSEANAIPVFQP